MVQSRRARYRLPTLTLAAFMASCSAARPEVSLSSVDDRLPGPLEVDYRILADEAYGPHDRQRMDLYLARDAERLGRRNFTIVFLHGGGFSFGDRANNERYIEPFLQRGMNVVNVSYRIRDGIPRATEDLTLALNHLERHAGEHGMRLDRIVVGGFSAGGQIASTVGFSQNVPEYPYRLNDGLRIVGILNVSGVVDRLDIVEEIFASSTDEQFQMVARNLFPSSSPFDRAETLRMFTPIAHLSEGDPAFFLWHGGQDDQIPPSTFASVRPALARSRLAHRVLYDPQGAHSPTDAQLREIFVELFRFLDEID
jgi:acetyl esterase/lipase